MSFDGFDSRFTAEAGSKDPRFTPVSAVQEGVFTGKAGGYILPFVSRYKILASPPRQFLKVEIK